MTTLKILLHQEIIEQKKFNWRKHSWVSSLAKKNNIHGYQESDICYGVYSFFFSYDRFIRLNREKHTQSRQRYYLSGAISRHGVYTLKLKLFLWIHEVDRSCQILHKTLYSFPYFRKTIIFIGLVLSTS